MDPVIPARLQSENVYHFRMEHANTIVNRLAYYNNKFRHSVIWYPSNKFLGVWDGMTYTFSRPSNATLGPDIGRLPMDILYTILENIDIRSLITFRQLNLEARHIVDSIPHGKYRRVIEHAYILLRALFLTQSELAAKISLVDLDTALCTAACAICGEFSGFISIPTWKRCCFSCLQRAPELRMQSLAGARKDFGLTKSQLDQLSLFQALPGTYTLKDPPLKLKRYEHTIVSIHQAAIISGRPPHPVPPWKQYFNENYMASCPLPFYDRRGDSHVVESGLSCLGCYYARSQNKNVATIEKDVTAEKLYTTDGFLRHFRRCEQAQRLWEMIEAGKELPKALQVIWGAGFEEPREYRYLSRRPALVGDIM
ncbi:hypothetical protein EV127DRAFT_376107 [Xylaria flabelliformis]|nr:hypothetical protein EV127DRAFT_376107 [Xylaria flabelliformis]